MTQQDSDALRDAIRKRAGLAKAAIRQENAPLWADLESRAATHSAESADSVRRIIAAVVKVACESVDDISEELQVIALQIRSQSHCGIDPQPFVSQLQDMTEQGFRRLERSLVEQMAPLFQMALPTSGVPMTPHN